MAIDRATRWVYVALKVDKTARLAQAAPFRIQTLLTDNGKEFTDRFVTTGERTPSGQHVFDQLCAQLGIEHRLTRPRHPQTNGMVERFNGRIADLLRTHHFRSSEDLKQTLHRSVRLYNPHLPQKALDPVSPVQTMKQWQHSHPQLFHKRVVNRPGYDS